MKVKNLIEELMRLDPELVVLHRNYDKEWCSSDYDTPHVRLEKVKKIGNGYYDTELYSNGKKLPSEIVEVAILET
jgi:hypothetical protein